MKKRITVFLIVISVVVGIFPVFALAAGTPVLSVSSTSGHVGDEITVEVKIENNPGLGFFQIDLQYDNTKLEPLSNGIIKTKDYANITSNIDYGSKVNLNDISAVTAIWYNDALVNKIKDGILYSVKFKIIGSNPDGIPVTLNVDDGNIADINFVEQNDLKFYDGVITVLEEGETSGAISVNKGITAYMLDDSTCRATIVNDDNDVTEAMLIAAIYDRETNTLEETSMCNLTVSNGSITKRLQFTKYNSEKHYVKLFLWDLNMEPMCVPGTIY